MPLKPVSVCTEMITETLLGRRGIVKAAHIWLPLAMMVTAWAGSELPSWIACLLLFGCAACYTQTAILANDLIDRQEDCAAGKQRWIFHFRPAAGAVIVALVAILGAALLLVDGWRWGVLAAYAAAVLIGLAYSIRPFRLKERGLWGPAAYSAASVLAFAVLPWAWFGAEWPMLAVIAPAVFLDKWTNLHFHQVIDIEADDKGNVGTFSVKVGANRARRSLRWVTALASVSMLAVLIYVLILQPSGRAVIGIVSASGLVMVGISISGIKKRRPEKATRLMQELPWIYLGLTLIVFRILPLLLLGRAVLADSAMWPVPAVFLVLLMTEMWHSYRYRYQ